MNVRHYTTAAVAFLVCSLLAMDADAPPRSGKIREQSRPSQLNHELTPAERRKFEEIFGLREPEPTLGSRLPRGTQGTQIEIVLRPGYERPRLVREFYGSRSARREALIRELYDSRSGDFDILSFWLAGERGDYERWVQESLNHSTDSKLTVDGIIGAETRRATEVFQEKNNLAIDGVVGPETQGALLTSFPISRRHVTHLRGDLKESKVESVYLDVKADGENTQITAWLKPTNSSDVRLVPNESWADVQQIKSPEDLREVLDENPNRTVIYRGDSLPSTYMDAVGDRALVRQAEGTSASNVGEIVNAAVLLGQTSNNREKKIFDALPGADPILILEEQLSRMGLDARRAEAWRRERSEITRIRGKQPGSKHETANRLQILEELQGGTSDVIFLIGHAVNGEIVMPNGARLSPANIRALTKRDNAPDRLIFLLGCETAVPKGLADALREQNLARQVIALREIVPLRDAIEYLEQLLEKDTDIRDVVNSNAIFEIIVHRSDQRTKEFGMVTLSGNDSLVSVSETLVGWLSIDKYAYLKYG